MPDNIVFVVACTLYHSDVLRQTGMSHPPYSTKNPLLNLRKSLVFYVKMFYESFENSFLVLKTKV